MRPAAAALLACVLLAVLPASANAAAPLTWTRSSTSLDMQGAPTGISCVSETLCVAVDGKGGVLLDSGPPAVEGAWTRREIDPGVALNAVSCSAEGLCAAVDADGYALISANAGSSWARVHIEAGATPLTGVSCASRSLCAAVAEGGELLVSTDPAATSGPWQEVEHVEGMHSISCLAQSCLAAGAGSVAGTLEPQRAHSWSARAIDATLAISSVSCEAAGVCVAVDAHGNTLASADPAIPSSTWNNTAAAPLGDLSAVSCAASGLCVAVGALGEAIASDDPATPLPAWSVSDPDPGGALTGVSCLGGGLCVAVDAAGHVLTARAPPPVGFTSLAGEVSAEGATLTGHLDAEDAQLGSCSFEYGTTAAYGASVPCAGMPAASAGEQAVSAAVGGLAPNTTYHYRLLAASPAGTLTGADVPFTTAASASVPIIHPRPAITGTPAVDSMLTCQSGVASSSGVRLAYQWLRNLVVIPSATLATYTVRGADNGAHLQCQATVTDGGGSATVTSAFVTVPYQSPPAAAGETSVGRAQQLGSEVTVPVVCALSASAGCRIALRLSTLRKGRPIVLASAVAEVPAGKPRTLVLALGATAVRTIRAHRRRPLTLTVSGTVIGVIEAQLSTQQLVLNAAAARAKGATRRTAPATPLARHPAQSATAHASQAAVRPPTLSATPYMGWDTYFAFGGYYDEATVLMQASQLVTLGLERDGYRYVWLDVGWWQGARSSSGQIIVNRAQWPHGMRWLAGTLHAAGFRVGLYIDAGYNGCGGTGEGSYGHYQQDVNTFAAWGFDAVKVDFCGGAELHLNPAAAYTSFHEAIAHNASHRPMLLNVCDFLQPDQYSETQPTLAESAFASYQFGPGVANSWRTDTDVGSPGHVSFTDVLRNLDADAAAPQAAGPGHWNDPDYLGAGQGLSTAQFRSQFSMWSMLAAPLMISDNLLKISAASLATVRDAAVIAVDQDPAGLQGTLLSSHGNGEVWVKPLAGGARAVALLNRGSKPLTVSTSAALLDLALPGPYSVTNLWTSAAGSTAGPIAATVPAQSTVLLRVAP